MATVIYKPLSPEDGKSVKMGGVSFEEGKAVEVTNEADLAKFYANPYFQVSGWKPKDGSASAARSSAANAPDAPPVSIANQTYPSQPPGVGDKTMGIPREPGSAEALIEIHGEEQAVKRAEETFNSLKSRKAAADKAKADADKPHRK
jgi:hypothetical protein